MCDILKRVGQICGCRKKPRPENRKIYVGHKAPPGVDAVVEEKYPSNRIVSSKYTIWTFLPKNLFSQFRRIANFYFLCVGLVELVIESPVSPVTSILPLVGVIFTTAVKQGYEDWLRHQADKEVNERLTSVVKAGQIERIQSLAIQVGDIVRVDVNEAIPCDLVMLSSVDPEGTCYITTANLDGETNLKTFSSVHETKHLQQVGAFESLHATIDCQQPTTDLYNFVGNLTVSGSRPRPLSAENVLLRGSRLRNTDYVYGCAIYTGPDTKISLNSKKSHIKYSQVEGFMNNALIAFLVILIVESAVLTGLKYWNDTLPLNSGHLRWYVGEQEHWSFKTVIEEFLSFMVLCNYIIPISLYVTVEIQKFFGSMFFEWDKEMYDAQSNEPAQAKTSDLNEELGQVEFLFTDKTGTLTENDMYFRQCVCGHVRYVDVGGMLCYQSDIPDAQPEPVQSLTPELEALLTVLALCHTVRVDGRERLGVDAFSMTGMEYDYQASSPDEKALVEACRRYGVIYHGVTNDRHEVTFKGTMRRYIQHHVLEFDPTRKRMSVIIEDERGEKYVLTKGAETAVLDQCLTGNKEEMENHINDYAMLGLRTLVIAWRRLSEEEFQHLRELLLTARQSLHLNRDALLRDAFREVEQNLELLGATAVEDKLQDGVADTIQSLREAGIQVWVLTGDKEETAVNISYAAGHFHSEVRELRLTNQRISENCGIIINQLTHILRDAQRSGDRDHALIIDGQSLVVALRDHREALQEMCEIAVTVLCCRMSPMQKAELVRLMKTSKRRPITAAIGDGANDVSMILEAHVGLGIMGKEGRQAVRSSDYAFGRFRFLKRALLVHGHFYYVRIATLVQYFFYKNVAFIIAQFYFVFFNSFSAQSLYDTVFLTFYNIVFTSLPILIYGLFEQDMQPEELLQQPELYKSLRRNAKLSLGQFLKWNFLALWHSVVVFFGVYLIFNNVTFFTPDGVKMDGVLEFGSIIFTTTVIIVNLKLLLEWYYLSVLTFVSYLLTLAGYCLIAIGYSGWLSMYFEGWAFYGVLPTLFSNYMVWLLMLVLVMIALLPDMTLRTLTDLLSPVYRQRVAKRRAQEAVTLLRISSRGDSTSSELSILGHELPVGQLDSPVFIVSSETPFYSFSPSRHRSCRPPADLPGISPIRLPVNDVSPDHGQQPRPARPSSLSLAPKSRVARGGFQPHKGKRSRPDRSQENQANGVRFLSSTPVKEPPASA